MSTHRNRIAANRMAGRPRYRPFGALRFGLAGMVLAQHGALLLPEAPKNIFYDLELGTVAVSVFFAVSGFIVAEAMDRFYAGRPGIFLANRMLRLLPPYLLVLALAIAVQSALFAAGTLVTLDGALHGPPWAMRVILAALCEIIPGLPTARLSGQDFSFIPYAWTLRVEFAFYFAAFATCAAMNRTRQRTAVLGGAIALGYAAFLLFVLRHGAGLRQILCVPFFAFGLACFLTEKRPGLVSRLNLLATALCVPLAFSYWGQRGHPIVAWQLACLGPLLLGFYILAHLGDVPEKVRRLDSRLGDLSYPLYIGHGIILVSLASLTEHRSWSLYASGMAGSVLLAAALHHFGEKPFQGLRDRLRGQRVAMTGNCNLTETK